MKKWDGDVTLIGGEVTDPTDPIENIAVPMAPVWTDVCGVDNNGSWSGYEDTDQYTWKITDHSEMNGKVGIVVSPAEGFAFPEGERVRWTQKQDNTRCVAVAPEVIVTDAVCAAPGVAGNGSIELNRSKLDGVKNVRIQDAANANVKKQADSLPAGTYKITANAAEGAQFAELAGEWAFVPGKDQTRIRTTVEISSAGDCVIELERPAAPLWTDLCGPDNNGFFCEYEDDAQGRYTWTVHDNSKLNGKVGIFATPANGYKFKGHQVKPRWTKVQDNRTC